MLKPGAFHALLLAAALGLGTAGLASGPARAADPIKVGFVYVAPIGDAGWTYQHELGRRQLEQTLGSQVKAIYVENVPEGADAERVIRQLAADGNQLIFTTSFGYMEPTLRVAKQFPKVMFEHATGYKRATNASTYSARFYEGRYLAGIIAGRMTKSNTLGYVAAFPIPEVVQGIDAFALGARSVNPKVQVKLVWTASWYDPGKEKEATDTLISQGADLVTNHTDSTAVVQAAEEKGAWSIGYNSDMAKFGPKTELTAVTMLWGDYYVSEVKAAIAGSWKSHDTWGGIKDGMIKLAPYNAAVPKAVQDEVAAKQAEIVSGKFHPFQGPIKDQSGATKIAQGAGMTDAQILELNWLVEGVQGQMPK